MSYISGKKEFVGKEATRGRGDKYGREENGGERRKIPAFRGKKTGQDAKTNKQERKIKEKERRYRQLKGRKEDKVT